MLLFGYFAEGFSGVPKKKWNFLSLRNNVLRRKSKLFLKFFLVVWKMVVSLHSLSTKQALLIKQSRKHKRTLNYFGTWDSVCRSSPGKGLEAETRDESKVEASNSYNEEFDPGSGWTLAAGLTHASRGAAGPSNGLPATGARVRNAYATCPRQGDNRWKRRLIPRNARSRMALCWKLRWSRMGMRGIR